MQIKAAYRRYNNSERVARNGGDDIGADLCWVEIDGHRFDQVVSLETKMEHAAQTVTISFLGALETVALDYKDEPIPRSRVGQWWNQRQRAKDLRALAARIKQEIGNEQRAMR